MARIVTHIVLHCTATPQSTTIESIQRYWREQLGWRSPGYHRVIRADGSIVNLQEYDRPTNGVAGHNANSIHIAYIGGADPSGKPIDNRTPAQVVSMIALIKAIRALYPNAQIIGHRDFPNVKKACPSFDAKAFANSILPLI